MSKKNLFGMFLTTIVLALCGFLLSIPDPASADTNYYVVAVGQPSGSMCLGETRMIGITWMTSNNALSALAPLAGPHAITVNAKRGTVDRYLIRPDSMSGTVFVNYTADSVGMDRIDVQVFSSSETADASDMAEFEVKQCKYRFTFTASMYDSVQFDDGHVATRVDWFAKGRLDPSGLTNSRIVEGKDKIVKIKETITSYSLPTCTYTSSEPARGFGFMDARAYPEQEGKSMVLEFSPPKDLEFLYAMTVICEEHTETVGGTYPVTVEEDPWITAVFPGGEGTFDIPVNFFQEAVDRMNAIPEHVASYTATVTLEKVEE